MGSLMSIGNATTLTINKQDKILLVPPYVILVNSWSLSLVGPNGVDINSVKVGITNTIIERETLIW